MATGKSAEFLAVELQESITDKLRVILGEEGVEILTEYVWHMLISPRCSRQHITEELQEFLADETAGFVEWVLSVIVPQIHTYMHRDASETSKESLTENSTSRQTFSSQQDYKPLQDFYSSRAHALSTNVQELRQPLDHVLQNFLEDHHEPRDTSHRSIPHTSSEQKNTGRSTGHSLKHHPGAGEGYSVLQQNRGRILGLAMQQAISNKNASHFSSPESSMQGRRPHSMPLTHVGQDSLGSREGPPPPTSHSSSGGLPSDTFPSDLSTSKSVWKRSPFDMPHPHDRDTYRQGNGFVSKNRGSPNNIHSNYQKHQCVSLLGDKRESRMNSKNSILSTEEMRRPPQTYSTPLYRSNEMNSPNGYAHLGNPVGPYTNGTSAGGKQGLPHRPQLLPYKKPWDYPPTALEPAYNNLHHPSLDNILGLQEAAAVQGYVLALPNHCTLPAVQCPPVANKLKKRCAKWPDCPFGDNCRFIHPAEMCNNWPHCPFGVSCFYIHPEVHCKFGLNCHNYNCNYTHPEGWDPTKNSVHYSFNSVYFQNKTLNLVNQQLSNKDDVRDLVQEPADEGPLLDSTAEETLKDSPSSSMTHSIQPNNQLGPLTTSYDHETPTDIDMKA